jgi:hypothetical protein
LQGTTGAQGTTGSQGTTGTQGTQGTTGNDIKGSAHDSSEVSS